MTSKINFFVCRTSSSITRSNICFYKSRIIASDIVYLTQTYPWAYCPYVKSMSSVKETFEYNYIYTYILESKCISIFPVKPRSGEEVYEIVSISFSENIALNIDHIDGEKPDRSDCKPSRAENPGFVYSFRIFSTSSEKSLSLYSISTRLGSSKRRAIYLSKDMLV